MSTFFQAALQRSKLKINSLKEVYVLGRSLWSSLSDEQKTEIVMALTPILTPEQLVNGVELHRAWQEFTSSNEEETKG